jgi:hypothetical protein
MRKILSVFIIILAALSHDAVAQEAGTTPGAEDATLHLTAGEAYHFPQIKPEASLHAGYRLVDLTGSERVEEFQYLHDSLTLGGELRLFSFPHRLHLVLDVVNEKDYFWDANYAYEDIVLFRAIDRTLFHNLDNISLIDLDPGSTNYTVDVQDRGEKDGVRVGIDNVFLRFKTHDFPLHAYINGTFIEKDGIQQQRTLLGSGSFNNIVRTSTTRDIDFKTQNIVVGVNSHLGPVEIDLSHGEKRLDTGGDEIFYDNYAPVGDPAGSTRIGGVYPHSLMPDLKGSSNTLKVHTSYTGRLVASATLSTNQRENRDSEVEADYFTGYGEISWIASPRLSFFMNYRHEETDLDNDDPVLIANVCSPFNNIDNDYECAVKHAISSVKDMVSGTVRYRPVSGLTLRGKYSYNSIRRSNAEEWELPDSTQKHIASISADTRLIKGLNVNVKYTFKGINDPAYNIEPDTSNEGSISLSWLPVHWVNTFVSYSITSEDRDDLFYEDTEDAENRDVHRDNFFGSVTFLVLKNLTVTPSYAYLHNKIEQDIEYHDIDGDPHIDFSVPFKDQSHHYSVNVAYMPFERLNLGASVAHSRSTAKFYPGSPDLLQPVSVASFSKLEIRETATLISGEYEFGNGFGLGVDYKYADFDDVLDNPYDDVDDGHVHIVLLSLSKKW